MKKIAKFEKVSYERFKADLEKFLPNKYREESVIKEMYNNIQLPTRATSGSAGYDFKCPVSVNIDKVFSVIIPTGIRAKIDDGWVLKIYPRSGLGFKKGLRLVNTVGIIDSDYYYSDNEGHIMLKVGHTEGDFTLHLQQGDGFCQGVFVEYGITEDDSATDVRNGGFGSTGK